MSLQRLRRDLGDILTRENIILTTSVQDITIHFSSLDAPEIYLLGLFILPVSYSLKYLPAYFSHSYYSEHFSLYLSYLQGLPGHLDSYQKWVSSNYSSVHMELIPLGRRYSYRSVLSLLYANGYAHNYALKRVNRLSPYLNLFWNNQERLFKNPLRIGRMLILERELEKSHEIRFLHQLYLLTQEQHLTIWELNYFLTLLKSRGFLVHREMNQDKLYDVLVSHFNLVKRMSS